MQQVDDAHEQETSRDLGSRAGAGPFPDPHARPPGRAIIGRGTARAGVNS